MCGQLGTTLCDGCVSRCDICAQVLESAQEFAQMEQTPVSLHDMREYGQQPEQYKHASLLAAATFLHREVRCGGLIERHSWWILTLCVFAATAPHPTCPPYHRARGITIRPFRHRWRQALPGLVCSKFLGAGDLPGAAHQRERGALRPASCHHL